MRIEITGYSNQPVKFYMMTFGPIGNLTFIEGGF